MVSALAATALTATAATAAPSPGPDHDRHAAVRAVMDQHVKEGIPGVLGRSEDHGATWKGSAGVADLSTGRKRTDRDRFRIGSVTKAFTSVVLLQLEAEGRLNLDDTVDRHLPGLVRGNGHDGTRITLRQLLNHTSGIYNYTADPELAAALTTGFPQHRYDVWKPGQLVGLAMRHQPDFAPGTGWNYSNTNYVLAGMVAEKVTGRSWAQEVRQRVLRPAGLRDTTLPGNSSAMPSPHGRAYSKLKFGPSGPSGPIQDTTELNPSWGWAAGEIISTTGDLNRFYSALVGGKLLPAKQQKELLTAVPTGPGGESAGAAGYGLGLMRAKLSCGTSVWLHTGGIHGSSTLAASTDDGRHTTAFNLNGDWLGDLGALVEAEYCGTVPPAKGHTAQRSPSLEKLTALR
ncbi:D-alanyl-D-alanine carboxypeptidase [Streptomyces mashuensis]|uniref:D-alanyl-D-alanine carboxypeptidase n=2 Tax=Streptomyces mashuensis TaxID=33904 RepID=A0A919AXQ9_9ACTN|nr:D-alanyl-D-alanine carboxypeptidase [Streptomyces mashuensis]